MKACCHLCEQYKEVEANGFCFTCNNPKIKKAAIPLRFKPREKKGELEMFEGQMRIKKANGMYEFMKSLGC